MTSLSLLSWIGAGIALQLVLYLGVVYWHHWQAYFAMRQALEASGLPAPGVPIERNPASPGAWADFRSFRVERKLPEDPAGMICSFYLAPEDGLPLPPFLPGQFLTFRLEMAGAAGETEQVIRCYSLSDAPCPDFYRVSIKRVPSPDGRLPPGRTSSFFHEKIEAGSLLQVRAPAGHFHLQRGEAPVVLIGAGIGITPVLSMLNWCLAEQPGREVWLFYGIRNSGERIMRQRLETMAAAIPNFHLRLCFSQPLPQDVAGQDYHHRGHIDLSLLRTELPLKPFHFYLCGPTALLESLVPALEDWGVPDARIHFEAFGPTSVKRRSAVSPLADTADGPPIMVDFVLSGKQIPWQAGSGKLLDFAEANGISIDSGCRAGGCGTCLTRIRSGEVAYMEAPDFDPEPGTCLPCVCSPKTSLTLEV